MENGILHLIQPRKLLDGAKRHLRITTTELRDDVQGEIWTSSEAKILTHGGRFRQISFRIRLQLCNFAITASKKRGGDDRDHLVSSLMRSLPSQIN